MISLAAMRVRYDGPWLFDDARLKTLYGPDHPARNPKRDTYFSSPLTAANALEIDHAALLDVVWKIRSFELLAANLRDRTACAKTRSIAIELGADFFSDVLDNINVLLAQKAEAELWVVEG